MHCEDGFDPVCGCPTRIVVIWPYEVYMHIEDDGSGDAHFDTGDFEFEKSFSNVSSLDEMQAKCVEFVKQQEQDYYEKNIRIV